MYLLALKKDLYLVSLKARDIKSTQRWLQTYTYLQPIKLYTLATYRSLCVHHTAIKWFKNNLKTETA